MQYINRVTNVTDSSFVLHFGITEMINYCNYNGYNIGRVTKAIRKIAEDFITLPQQFYISLIDSSQFFDISNNPLPTLNGANHSFNTANLRADASGNILSIRIQCDTAGRDYQHLIIEGIKKGEFVLIPRVVTQQGIFNHYMIPFRGDKEDESPVGEIKILAFDFYNVRSSLEIYTKAPENSPQGTAELEELIAAAFPLKEEEQSKGGWSTNTFPNHTFYERKIGECNCSSNNFRVEGEITLSGNSSAPFKNIHTGE